MTKNETASYRKALAALADSLDRSLAHDRGELMRRDEPNLSGGSIPATDAEADEAALEVGMRLVPQEEAMLTEVAAALARIEAGTFGICEGCGKAISRARLEALPYARRCIRCARVAENVPG